MTESTLAHGGHAHPTPKTYAKIAAVLCIITAIEFVCYYVQALRGVLVPLLLVLSGIKFALVVMFYMHLKFDHNVFTRLLLVGLFLGAGVVLSLFALYAFSHPL
jgi:caa(3)-type oxidase subunit IV